MQSSLKLKDWTLFFLHLKLCICSSSCQNNVYCKVAKVAGLTHRSPACCCTARSRRQRASSKTPTGTGGTGHPRWPTPDSARPRHPGTARGKYTPDPPTSGASTPTRALPPLRSRMRPCLLDPRRWGVMLRCVAENPGTMIPDKVFGSVFAISVLKIVEQLRERDAVTAALALLWTRLHCTLLKNLGCTCRVLVPRIGLCLVWTIRLQTEIKRPVQFLSQQFTDTLNGHFSCKMCSIMCKMCQ